MLVLAPCKQFRTQQGGETDPGIYCRDLLASQCAEDSECEVVGAWAVIDVGFGACVDFTGDKVGVGCQAAGRNCESGETWAGPPPPDTGPITEDCWLFDDTCIPDEWVPCDEYDEC
jgi:hypothetical protein